MAAGCRWITRPLAQALRFGPAWFPRCGHAGTGDRNPGIQSGSRGRDWPMEQSAAWDRVRPSARRVPARARARTSRGGNAVLHGRNRVRSHLFSVHGCARFSLAGFARHDSRTRRNTSPAPETARSGRLPATEGRAAAGIRRKKPNRRQTTRRTATCPRRACKPAGP